MLALNLQAKTRQLTGKKVAKLRTQGEIPAVLFGHGIKPTNLTLNYNEFDKIFHQAGESTLIDLSVDGGKPVKVLVQDCQLEPLKSRINHVDLHQVRMDEKLHTEIPLKFINEAPAVKEFSGILVTNIHAIEVECLPQDLVHEIEVDLTALKKLEDVITVADLKIPAGIQVKISPEEAVMLVQPPRSEKEMSDLEAKPEEKLPEEAKEAAEAAAEAPEAEAK